MVWKWGVTVEEMINVECYLWNLFSLLLELKSFS